MKNILITGASGFIGKKLYKLIKNKKYKFILTKRASTTLPKINFSNTDVIDWDFEKQNTLNKKVDILIHLAAEKNNKDKMQLINFSGTKHIIKSAIESGAKKVIFISSISIYNNYNCGIIDENTTPDPLSAYGLSKLAAETFLSRYCQKKNIDYTIIRPTDIIGLRNKSFLNLVRVVNKGYFFYVGDHRKVITNYVTLNHVCYCIIYFIENTKKNDYIINEPVKLNEIIVTISKTLKIDTPVHSVPKFFGYIFSFLCDILQKTVKHNIPYNFKKYSELTNKTTFSNERLLKDTGIKNQYPLINEIRHLTNYYIKNKFL